jgi:hypothetical protein
MVIDPGANNSAIGNCDHCPKHSQSITSRLNAGQSVTNSEQLIHSRSSHPRESVDMAADCHNGKVRTIPHWVGGAIAKLGVKLRPRRRTGRLELDNLLMLLILWDLCAPIGRSLRAHALKLKRRCPKSATPSYRFLSPLLRWAARQAEAPQFSEPAAAKDAEDPGPAHRWWPS